MCKICTNCNGLMNYDPYFEAEICVRCGKIERKPKNNALNNKECLQQFEIMKRIFEVQPSR